MGDLQYVKPKSAVDRLRIAYLVPYDPYSPRTGGRARMKSIHEALSRFADVHLLVVDDPVVKSAPDAKIHAIPPRPESKAQMLWRYARAAISHRGLTLPRIDLAGVGSELTRISADAKLDAIILGTFDYAPLAKWSRQFARTIIVDSWSVESKWNFAVARGAFPSMTAAKHFAMGLSSRNIERFYLRDPDQVWAVRDEDAHFFRASGAMSNVIPNVVLLHDAGRDLTRKRRDTIAFIGSYRYSANVEAALQLVEYSRDLDRRGISHRVLLIGQSPSAAMRRATTGTPSVEITGMVPDLEHVLGPAGIFAAPIMTGAGTKLKLVDAMNYGCAIITTPLGAEGLPLEHQRNALIVDPDKFGAALADLLVDQKLQEHLSQAAYATAQDYSSPEHFERTLWAALSDVTATMASR